MWKEEEIVVGRKKKKKKKKEIKEYGRERARERGRERERENWVQGAGRMNAESLGVRNNVSTCHPASVYGSYLSHSQDV